MFDITSNHFQLYYRHIGPHSTGVVMDVHPFRVKDNNDPPNVSDLYDFTVKVLPVDDIPPKLHPSSTLQVSVRLKESFAPICRNVNI